MIRRVGLLILAVGMAAAAPAELTGVARVVDGDTFSLGAERVRLWGVDAPDNPILPSGYHIKFAIALYLPSVHARLQPPFPAPEIQYCCKRPNAL